MDNEIKETLEVTKPATVAARINLPKALHAKAMKVHATNPRKWTFDITLIDLIKKGLDKSTL